MNLPPLILASASPRRAELVRQLGLEFQVVRADVPEDHSEHLTARELCLLNAYRKARSVAKKFSDMLVLGADTLVCLDSTLFGKPASMAEAERMLMQLQGQTHEVVTGVCLVHLRTHRQSLFAESSRVTFRPLSLERIRSYLAKVNPLDKAGAYAIQEETDLIVDHVSGSFSNVVGLPVERLKAELAAW